MFRMRSASLLTKYDALLLRIHSSVNCLMARISVGEFE
jgi:hypothetical protein